MDAAQGVRRMAAEVGLNPRQNLRPEPCATLAELLEIPGCRAGQLVLRQALLQLLRA